ncbi:hypothetical protein OPW36_11180 [Vibrio europaeus]|uniref:hypothetical protein n=1 Tax=Vibrio europaeus TaxID=300876 RepID=UPI00233E5CE7|nr:hypothetical protein [Vibrio europaeus]MDC5808025.1 hypothetical protein [Vibrio europaeus]MDC5825274.1 hypothetical protein [Vibrio europaeus]MDC5830851.1 hypothetical protein [Vibrio europaeus]MDC5833806.1 hypothetical protein [Vibrio europaeus]
MKAIVIEHLANLGMFDQVVGLFLLFIIINLIYILARGLDFTYHSVVNSIIACISAYGFISALTIIAILENNANLVLPLAISMMFQFVVFIMSLLETFKKREQSIKA